MQSGEVHKQAETVQSGEVHKQADTVCNQGRCTNRLTLWAIRGGAQTG